MSMPRGTISSFKVEFENTGDAPIAMAKSGRPATEARRAGDTVTASDDSLVSALRFSCASRQAVVIGPSIVGCFEVKQPKLKPGWR
ncbi:hypothetical protein LTR99_009398 [Exophiala xenobiotica]|uniref:Uncharacterized protein n=1 Tax=Vermiconidia calcicola TaxID=1690605 RepID=A0AAV9Q165_9PEZI|nr:hypothetical protein LTR92_002225 [Exophiala xenobiotica]KAK5530926.1 hypothetical protein LTR25_008783 [Vermiconidia calcicola]KAK5544418.1 hypothetical protein LTR23_004506 [Chaetothyriales sp. CCFEE 6169]KAK5228463.1 hypothetical protein LTR72_002346 [Exophiala xenobiotica]KAK5269043.1 hypothetical protein LTR96_005827 [Exophiala xenobiotica]